MFVKIGDYAVNPDKVKSLEVKPAGRLGEKFAIVAHWTDVAFDTLAIYETKEEAEAVVVGVMNVVNWEYNKHMAGVKLTSDLLNEVLKD